MVIDRIIPRDEDPSATDLGVDRYVLRQIHSGAVPDQHGIRTGLEALSTVVRERCRSDAGAKLADHELDTMLQDAATTPWFQLLTELVAEGYYADPGNGGNADARSWTMVGYEHRLPDGPDGPPFAELPIEAARSRTGDAPDDMEAPSPAETAEPRSHG